VSDGDQHETAGLDRAAAAARSLWPELARQAGLDPADWRLVPFAGRSDRRVERVLLKAEPRTGGPALIVKHQRRPNDPGAFAAALASHAAAQAGFVAAPGIGLQPLLAADPENMAGLFGHVEGRPLIHVLPDAGADNRLRLLEMAGRWTAAFHAARPGIRREFRPPANLRQLRTVLAELSAGTRAVSEPARFTACARRLLDDAGRYAGRETVTAHQHGDLHLRNLLYGDCIWGIDVAAGAVRPVGHDLARLLVDYAARIADPHTVPPGGVLPEPALAAFLSGYRRIGADDPSLGLLLRLRVLADWWGLPARSENRALAQGRRLAGLLAIADRAWQTG
jgi:hypothetical protein